MHQQADRSDKDASHARAAAGGEQTQEPEPAGPLTTSLTAASEGAGWPTRGALQRLQRTSGNQAVLRLIGQSPVQREYITPPYAGQPQMRAAFGGYTGLLNVIGQYRTNVKANTDAATRETYLDKVQSAIDALPGQLSEQAFAAYQKLQAEINSLRSGQAVAAPSPVIETPSQPTPKSSPKPASADVEAAEAAKRTQQVAQVKGMIVRYQDPNTSPTERQTLGETLARIKARNTAMFAEAASQVQAAAVKHLPAPEVKQKPAVSAAQREEMIKRVKLMIEQGRDRNLDASERGPIVDRLKNIRQQDAELFGEAMRRADADAARTKAPATSGVGPTSATRTAPLEAVRTPARGGGTPSVPARTEPTPVKTLKPVTPAPASLNSTGHTGPVEPWAVDPRGYLASLKVTIVSAGKPIGEAHGKLKDWTDEELVSVAAIFSKLGADQSVVHDTALERVTTMRPGAKGTKVSGGEVARFGYVERVSGPAGNKFVVSDLAYNKIATTAGDAATKAPRSVAHEVGHAVETASQRAAYMALGAAIDDANKKLAAFDEARLARGAAYKNYTDALARYNKNLMSETDFDAIDALYEQKKGVEARLLASHDAADAVSEAKQAELEAVFHESKDKSHRLLNFVNYVNSNGIKPDLTQYASDTWPHQPNEFFAEAYMYWIVDKAGLGQHSPELLKYFSSGAYLNDRRPR